MIILGIDIGATGIKGAPVNVRTGKLLAERYRIDTPDPATPRAVSDVVCGIVKHFDWSGKIGCGMPGVIREGKVHSAGYLSPDWIGKNAHRLLERTTRCPLTLLNDADAAGLAEMQFGAGADHGGSVLVITLGTGIGTSLFVNGCLVPNLRLGFLIPGGKSVKSWVHERARLKRGLTWKQWAARMTKYLSYVEDSVFPDLIIATGGLSKQHGRFLHLIKTRAKIVPAAFKGDSGIVGAALAVTKGISN